MLIIIAIFLILISTNPRQNNFTLLNYFTGEYTSYTEEAVGEESIDLGFCYMQNKTSEKNILVGESVKIKNFEPVAALKKLNARVIKTEYIENGTVVIYAYSNLINKNIKVDNQNVNLQIAHNDNYTIIGWPQILGSF